MYGAIDRWLYPVSLTCHFFGVVDKRLYYRAIVECVRTVDKSVCWLHVRLSRHALSRLPLDTFPFNFILGTFLKICRENENLVPVGQEYRAL